jgi:hypothetical protein
MATLHKEASFEASPEEVWDAVRDIGALHTRLVPGFVVKTELEGEARMATFGNGLGSHRATTTLAGRRGSV